MSSTIPQLKLFPLYPGGPVVRSGSGTLNAESSFFTRQTEFTPAFGVNTPPSGNVIPDNTYLTIQNDQTLAKRPISQASVFASNLAVDGTVLGKLKSVSPPATAPDTPKLYDQLVALYSITDLKFADLMAQASFRIPSIGLGVEVTTDGMGGVDTIAINPSSRSLGPNPSVFNPFFAGPNQTEITTGATFTANPAPGLGTVASGNPSPVSAQVNNTVGGTANPLPLPIGLNRLNQTEGLFRLGGPDTSNFDALRPGLLESNNPVLARLRALEIPEQGLSVAGFDATVTAEQSRQIATVNAKFDLGTDPQFRENVARLVSAASQQSDTYQNLVKPHSIEQLVNGKIPMVPSLPATPESSQLGMNFGMGGQENFGMGAAVSDAMQKKGSGGYIPFQMQGQSGGEGQGFSGGDNPFMGSGGQMTSGGRQSQQQMRQRQPMAFMA